MHCDINFLAFSEISLPEVSSTDGSMPQSLAIAFMSFRSIYRALTYSTVPLNATDLSSESGY